MSESLALKWLEALNYLTSNRFYVFIQFPQIMNTNMSSSILSQIELQHTINS